MAKPAFTIVGGDKVLKALSRKTPKAKRLFKNLAGAYAADVREAVRAVVPVHTRNLKRSIKSRTTSSGGAIVYADRSGGSSGKGFHIHMVRKGTKKRSTKKGRNRGTMPANGILDSVMDNAVAQFLPRVGAPLLKALAGELKSEVNK